jgi:hypothetical protein
VPRDASGRVAVGRVLDDACFVPGSTNAIIAHLGRVEEARRR